jgi:acyl-coenzyme A synthetase/AMP-(fatty) acid ligase
MATTSTPACLPTSTIRPATASEAAPAALMAAQPARRRPLIEPDCAQRVVAWRGAQGVTQAQFLGDVRALADRLPEASHALNLCEDRYHFMTAFAAVCLRGQTNLLPPSQAAGVISEIADRYPGCYAVGDGGPPDGTRPWIAVADPEASTGRSEQMVPTIAEEHLAALVFTSGSTGAPQAHPKSWRTLAQTAHLIADRFLDPAVPGSNIVATVPAQHMYGLETTVMMALAGSCAIHAGLTFYPADLREALAQLPAPRILVTTPLHLRACVSTPLPFAPLGLVISATAPLGAELAATAERALGAPVHEIYGCTEAGSMATRHTMSTDIWRFFPGMSLTRRDDADYVLGRHLDSPVALPDVVDALGEGSFRLRGRSSDMIKVGGKRSSLNELTRRLLQVPGVSDAVVFVPEPRAGEEARPAALVVAEQRSEREILAALSQLLDPVFLPRPLLRVARLPRNAVGKLPHAALLAELERARG